MRLVFFGTPAFAATILDYLLQQKAQIVGVVTRPDKPKGRSNTPCFSPVKQLALAHHLPLLQPGKISAPEGIEALRQWQADVFVVAAFAEILQPALIALPPLGCINVHASVLPRYRGAAPIARCVEAGENETGVTIMKIAPALDAGDMLAVAKIPLTEDMTAGELTDALATLGAHTLWDALQRLEKGSLVPMPQDNTQATYARKLTSAEAEVQWERPAAIVYNHIRAMTPKPGAWTWIWIRGEKKRLLIKKARKKSAIGASPKALVPGADLSISCLDGSIQLLEVQLEGKSPLSAAEFLRGYPPSIIKF